MTVPVYAPPEITMIDFLLTYDATDKDWFYKNADGSARTQGGGIFPQPEMIATRQTRIWPVVSRRGEHVNFDFQLYNPNGGPGSTMVGYLLIQGFKFTSEDPAIGAVELGGGLFTSFEIGATSYVTWEIEITDLPDVVAKGQLTCDVYITNSGGWWGEYPLAKLYLVDESPKSHMAHPWTEVLEYACGFASNKSGKASVLEYCTKGLYGSGLFTYSGDHKHWIHDLPATDDGVDPHNGYFMLKGLLDETTLPHDGECRDVSSFLSLCTAAVGHAVDLTLAWTGIQAGFEGQLFLTNEIKPIGGSSYSQTDWHFHQIAKDGDNAYDACAKFQKDLSGATYNQVPFGWPIPGYWQTSSGSTFVGLVRGYPSPGTYQTVPYLFEAAKLKGPIGATVTLLQGVE